MISPKRTYVAFALIAATVALPYFILKPSFTAENKTPVYERPLILTQPKFSRYCAETVREEFGEWETSHFIEFEEQRNLCINQLLAEQGDPKAHAALEKAPQPAHDYSATAKKLIDLAEKSDLPTLAKLYLSTKDIPADEYLAEFYKNHGIQPADPNRFPVRLFDWNTAPMPASTFARWLDDNTVIYTATLYAGTPAPIKSVVSLDVTSLHRELDLPEEKLEAARPPQLVRRHDGCQELGSGAFVCRKILEPQKEIKREDGITEHLCPIINQQVAVFTTPEGSFEYDFKYPVNINFRYDAFSEQYWLTADTKVWRFSKDLKPLGEQRYPKGVWGTIICAMSSGFRTCTSRQEVLHPCDIFKDSTKAGFLVPGHITIYDRDQLDTVLIKASALYLLTRDGSAIQVLPKFDNVLPHVAVSPDGCKAAFIHSPDKDAQLGIIELCKASP